MKSATNPYAAHLGASDAPQVLRTTATRLRGYVNQLGSAGLGRSYDGKWSAHALICHLADTEIAFGFRLRQALAEPNHVIQPFDQDAWAKPYGACDTETALALFTALRAWNVILVDTLPPEAASKTVTHPERGTMTIQMLLETFAGHDVNHLQQLDAILQRSGTGASEA